MIQEWIFRLTDVYKKDENSNIGKLLLIIDGEIEQIKSAFNKTEEWRDVNEVEGTTLDLFGENIGQVRGKTSDDIYRVLIKGKMALNRVDGTINKILSVLAVTLDCGPSEITIKTLKETGDNEPAAFMITQAPLDALNRVGLSPNQLTQIVQKTAAAGVRVSLINLNGTFSLSSQANVLETSDQGLSSDGSDGGTLGGVYSPDQESVLPF